MIKKTCGPKERHAIAILLDRHCKTVDGYAHYDEGYSDYAIAEEMGRPELHGTVAGMRLAVYGKIRVPKEEHREQSNKLQALEMRIAALEAMMGAVR